MGVKLDEIFDSFSENRLFKDKSILQTSYTPENIPHRDNEIKQAASILAPALRGERTSNLFIYGQTGTGKTLSIHYLKNEMMKRAKKEGLSLDMQYLNCKLRKVSDTQYRILAELIKKLGGSVPATGLPTDQVYNKFIEIIDKEKKILILILDEIDQAVKKISDEFLYNFTRLNSELNNANICLIGISNDLNFLDNLDPRVRSSLGQEEIVFSPYNALQLQEILKSRADNAFNQGVLEEGVIQKCAAYAAREHGDARRALDLLRIAGEISERNGEKKVTMKSVDLSNQKIDRDKILDVVQAAPKQFQMTLLSIILLSDKKNKSSDKIFTGDVYNKYHELCLEHKSDFLTQRRVSDIIAEIDMLGLINAIVISKGRHGRTKEIKLSISPKILDKVNLILKESLDL
ncbi:MAG: orc1/cdc6 family replication initiation protein [Nanoarchaeota archaeon]|nr:orc1/cdc6 family replication initiation protein [Nanoarchaeota archaeon]